MKRIREELGFSQLEMALLLNISRSSVSMYEKGLRHLPSAASQKWAGLQLIWNENRKRTLLPRGMDKDFLKKQQSHSLSLLEEQLQRAAERAVSLTLQLSMREKQHGRLTKKLHFLKELMAGTKPGSRERSLLQNMEKQALIGLADCCPERRQLLAFKLQVLQSQQKAAQAGKVILQQQR